MPSQRLKDYIRADKLEKEAKAEKALNRAFVDRLLRRAKGMGVFLRGITYQERETVKFDSNELLTWVRTQCMVPILDDQGELQYDEDGEIVSYPDEDTWLSLTKVVIDEEKLEQAVEDGIIDLSNLPKTCYTSTISKVVTVDHKKLTNG